MAMLQDLTSWMAISKEVDSIIDVLQDVAA